MNTKMSDMGPFRLRPLPPLLESTESAAGGGSRVSCMEAWENHCWLGYEDGHVRQFLVVGGDQASSADSTFVCARLFSSSVGNRVAVRGLWLNTDDGLLFVLTSDGMMYGCHLLTLEPLNGDQKNTVLMRGVHFCAADYQQPQRRFCLLNSKPAVSASRQAAEQAAPAPPSQSLRIVGWNNGQCKLHVEREMPTPPGQGLNLDGLHINALAFTGDTVCYADVGGLYHLVNCSTGTRQVLFSVPESLSAWVLVVGPGEFLLGTGGPVGVFIDAAGQPVRGTISWPTPPSSVQIELPYVVAMFSSGTVLCHWLHDQMLVQSIDLKRTETDFGQRNCKNIEHCYSHLYKAGFGFRAIQMGSGQRRHSPEIWTAHLFIVNNENEITALSMLSFEMQSQSLLEQGKCDDAVQLMQHLWAARTDVSDAEKQKWYENSGLFLLDKKPYDAIRLWKKCPSLGIAPLKSISGVFADESGTNSSDVLGFKTDHYSETQIEMHQAVGNYLSDLFNQSLHNQLKMSIAIALIRVYSLSSPSELIVFLNSSNIRVNISTCYDILERKQRFFALILLYRHSGNYQKALHLCKRIMSLEISDSFFPGETFLFDLLHEIRESSDADVWWETVIWYLQKNPGHVAKIFTPTTLDSFGHDVPRNIEFVKKCGEYVHFHFLILAHSHFKIKYANQLFSMALSRLRKLDAGWHITKSLDERFRRHAREIIETDPPTFVAFLDRLADLPDDYKTARDAIIKATLSSKGGDHNNFKIELNDSPLLLERALCHGTSEPSSLIEILVNQLEDVAMAMQFCVTNFVGTERMALLDKLLAHLLALPAPWNNIRAKSLLKNNIIYMDIKKSLEAIPDSWPVSTISSIIEQGLVMASSNYHRSKIEKGISKSCWAIVRNRWMGARSGVERIVQDDGTKCAICGNMIAPGKFCLVTDEKSLRKSLAHWNCWQSGVIE